MKLRLGFLMMGIIGVACCCEASLAQEPLSENPQRIERVELVKDSHLSNVFRIGDSVLSGSGPHDASAFAELAAMGVTTIVSVDGTTPDIAAAREHGIRYIHIPIGYDQVDAHAIASLARLAQEPVGTVYIHCHHGKHRGPAAVAAYCQLSGRLNNAQSLEFMRLAGTGEQYQGLWQSVQQLQAPAADAELPKLVEVSEVNQVAAAMSRLEQAFDPLSKSLEHPDADSPTAEERVRRAEWGLLVMEGLVESHRTLPEDAEKELKSEFELAMEQARKLHTQFTAEPATEFDQIKTTFKRLSERCTACHRAFR
jgi:protein tyrosine phosphatase (PTP) superfamily phosphohydrolase (DUF442 family)